MQSFPFLVFNFDAELRIRRFLLKKKSFDKFQRMSIKVDSTKKRRHFIVGRTDLVKVFS